MDGGREKPKKIKYMDGWIDGGWMDGAREGWMDGT